MGVFLDISVLLISNLIPLWSENIPCITYFILNLLRCYDWAYGLSLRLLQGILRKMFILLVLDRVLFINVNYIRLIHNAVQFIYILPDFLLAYCVSYRQIGDENTNCNSGFIYFSLKFYQHLSPHILMHFYWGIYVF